MFRMKLLKTNYFTREKCLFTKHFIQMKQDLYISYSVGAARLLKLFYSSGAEST